MKKLNIKKIITIIFNTLLILLFTSTVLADSGDVGAVKVPQEVKDTLTNLTNILLLIGTAVCIGKVIHIGILYVTSTAMDKSQAKQAILPWIIGTVVCFGAATIGGAIIKIFTEAGLPGNVLDY